MSHYQILKEGCNSHLVVSYKTRRFYTECMHSFSIGVSAFPSRYGFARFRKLPMFISTGVDISSWQMR
jgi:hypothetical protein